MITAQEARERKSKSLNNAFDAVVEATLNEIDREIRDAADFCEDHYFHIFHDGINQAVQDKVCEILALAPNSYHVIQEANTIVIRWD